MAVRLREADSMAAVAEMRQRIAELEIQVSGGVGWVSGYWGSGLGLCLTAVPAPAGRGRRAASRVS